MAGPFVGMQVHAHDFVDEGVETVLKNMQERAGVDAVLAEVNVAVRAERHPSPSGNLPHNPKRSTYVSVGGTVSFTPSAGSYARTKLKPIRNTEDFMKDFEILRDPVEIARSRGMKFYAWVQCLSNFPLGERHPDCLVVDLDGSPNDHGSLCVNNPHVREYALGLVDDVVSNSRVDGVFLDRFRYIRPDEGQNPFYCFCRHCMKRAADHGYNPHILKNGATRLRNILRLLTANDVRELSKRQFGVFDIMEKLSGMPEVLDWLCFRIESVTSFIEEAYRLVKSKSQILEVGLDAQPPSFSWLLGQDYRSLRDYCDWVKPITYPKWRGQMIANILTSGTYSGEKGGTFESLEPTEAEEESLTLAYRLLGIEGPLTLDQAREGLPNNYIRYEALRARNQIGDRKRIYMGQQIWDVSADDVTEQIREAKKGGCDGVVYYCYGWAPLSNFDAANKAWSA